MDAVQITVSRHGRSRFWAVRDGAGDLICVCVYKRGALEVARRLSPAVAPTDVCLRETAAEYRREPLPASQDASRAGV